MLLRNFFYGGQQRSQIIQIGPIRADRVEQRFSLVAVALVVHIKYVF